MARNGMGLGLLGLGILLVLGAIVCAVMMFIPSSNRNDNMKLYVFGLIAGGIGGGFLIIKSDDYQKKVIPQPST